MSFWGMGRLIWPSSARAPYASHQGSLRVHSPGCAGGPKEYFLRGVFDCQPNQPFQQASDLKGQTFAFTDPDSNTGKLVPTFWLAELHQRPEPSSGNYLTYSHDDSILAVARGLVAAATVDGLVWKMYQATNPVFTSQTRIIKKCELTAFHPWWFPGHLSAAERDRLQQTLLAMHRDPEGRNPGRAPD